LCLIGSRDGREGSVTIHQDVDLYASVLEDGKQVTLDGVAHRRVFIQVVSGELRVNGELVSAGDGVQIRQEDSVNIAALSESEFLLFNLS
jgi:redox-sensitive bicupin YhaK (pirin superfamily)